MGAGLVSRLLRDPAAARRLGDAAQQRARELPWRKAAETVARVARRAAGAHDD
jgi:hypothetical protein